MAEWRLYAGLIWPDVPVLALAFAAGISSACVGSLLPAWTANAMQCAFDRRVDELPAVLRRMALANVVLNLLTSARGALFTLAQARMLARLTPRLFANFLKMPFHAIRGDQALQTLTDDARFVSEHTSTMLNVLTRTAAGSAVAVAIMGRLSWRLTAMSLLVAPVHLCLVAGYDRYYERFAEARRTAERDLSAFMNECVTEFMTLKTLDAARWLVAKHDRLTTALLAVHRREAAAYTLQVCLANNVPNLFSLAVLWVASGEVVRGRLSPANLVSFMLYQPQLYAACQTFVQESAKFPGLRARVASVHGLLRERESRAVLLHDNQQHDDYRRLPSLLVWVDGLAFRWPSPSQNGGGGETGDFVLRDVNLQLFRGERVALAGPNGASKSTLVKLLLGLYVPTRGNIRFREGCVVSAVMQEPALFRGTVLENLMMGSSSASALDAQAAARTVLAHPFIQAMPLGYDTDISSTSLSGGQKQRLAIARAMLRRPDVFIMDEATSALDGDSEANLMIALNAFKHAGILIIAHRPSTLAVATRVVHMSQFA